MILNEKSDLEDPKKKDNNNNFGHSHNFLDNSHKKSVTTEQLGLFGELKIKKEYKLSKNYKHLLGIMELNPDLKVSRNLLIKLKSKSMHMNTITNFLKESLAKGLIYKCNVITGATVNTMFMYKKFPDTFEDGTICKDNRAIYYQITKLGIEVLRLQ